MVNIYSELLSGFTDDSILDGIDDIKVDSGLKIETASPKDVEILQAALDTFNISSDKLVASLNNIFDSNKPSLPNFIINIKKRD